MKRALLLAALLLAACSGREKEDEAPNPVALVRTEPAQLASLTRTLEAYGQAEIAPSGERTAPAPADSIVTALYVAVGDRVRAGQPVALLTPAANTKLDLDRAQRDAETAQKAYDREQRLRASGLASDADVESARAAAGTAAEAAKSLRGRTGGTGLKLAAPASGVVETLPVAPGDAVAMGAQVLKVGDPGALRVRLGLEPGQAARVRPGDQVRLVSLQRDLQALARVASVDPRGDPQTRQSSVVVALPPGAGFSAGESIRGEIAVARDAPAATAPRGALLYDGDRPYVFVAAGGSAHRRDVTLGAEQDDRVEIRSGLKPGEWVVVEGASALAEGMAVREPGRDQRRAP